MKPRPSVTTRVETYVIRVTIRWRRRLSMPVRAKKLHLGMYALARALVSSHHWAVAAAIAATTAAAASTAATTTTVTAPAATDVMMHSGNQEKTPWNDSIAQFNSSFLPNSNDH